MALNLKKWRELKTLLFAVAWGVETCGMSCLKEIISENEHAVISTGGGTACHHGNIDIMNKEGLTVYLKMHPSSLTKRLNMARRLRPVIRNVEGTDMRNFIEGQLSEREKFYNKATITVKGESLDLDGLVGMLRKC